MQRSNLEPLQKRLDEAVQEIALLRRALYLANESLRGNGSASTADEQITEASTVRSYFGNNIDADGAEKAYILELGRLLFKAGIIPSSTIFDEQAYLADNPDVTGAVATRRFASGFEHWLVHGLSEGRTATSKIVSVDRLGEEVISAYRSHKVKRQNSPLNYLRRLLVISRPDQQA